MPRIAIDTMGGDQAPGVPIAGAIRTVSEHPELEVVLVGPTDLIEERLASEGPTISPENLVEGCLRLLGHYELTDENHQMLVNNARNSGVSSTDTSEFSKQVGEMLQMIVATKEYLYA
jgi:2-phosphoglycerate kinase